MRVKVDKVHAQNTVYVAVVDQVEHIWGLDDEVPGALDHVPHCHHVYEGEEVSLWIATLQEHA